MLKLSTDSSDGLAAILRLPGLKMAALAVAMWAILFIPQPYTGLSAESVLKFRDGWGPFLWAAAIVFSLLAVVAAVGTAVSSIQRRVTRRRARKALSIEPLPAAHWWQLGEQRDGSLASQIQVRFHILNRRARPVKIIAVNLLRPMTRLPTRGHIMLPLKGSPFHSPEHPAMPNIGVWAEASFSVSTQLGFKGWPLTVSVQLIDDLGTKYDFKKLVARSRDLDKEKRSPFSRALMFMGIQPNQRKREAEVLDWNWVRADSRLNDPLELILKEEQRVYAVRGRSHGQLGSLNTGLHSGPTMGWTPGGKVPQILWDRDEAEKVESRNVDRLLRLHAQQDTEGKRELEEQLLNLLHRGSPFANVSYLIMVSLHRMGRTVDAFQKAGQDLQGDHCFGYSNTLGALSALISREHYRIDLKLINEIRECSGDDKCLEFQLMEKLDLAKLLKLDAPGLDQSA